MRLEFSFGIFRPEKQAYLSLSNRIFRKLFVNGEQALRPVYADEMFQTEICVPLFTPTRTDQFQAFLAVFSVMKLTDLCKW